MKVLLYQYEENGMEEMNFKNFCVSGDYLSNCLSVLFVWIFLELWQRTTLMNVQGVSKKGSFARLAPLETPRRSIGLEISPKRYPILHIGQTYYLCSQLPIFIPFVDGFLQIMDWSMDHLRKKKSLWLMCTAQSASEFFIQRFSTIYMKCGSYRLIPIFTGELHLSKFSFINISMWLSNTVKNSHWERFILHCSSVLVLAWRHYKPGATIKTTVTKC